MYEFMREMQFLAFQQLEPDACHSITKRLDHLKVGGGDKIARIAMDLQLLLGEGGLKVSVSGREKHPYSIWKKMQERHISFEQLTDVMAFRVITERAEDCYRALGIIHQRYKMVRSEEHTSELQSLMRTSYAVLCLKKKKSKKTS